MNTEIKNIEWNESTNKMSFSWRVTCGQGEDSPDEHFLLLYKTVPGYTGDDNAMLLAPEYDGVMKADLFCEASGVERSCTKSNLAIDSQQLVLFTIYPYRRGTKDVKWDAGSSKLHYVGRKSAVEARLISEGGSTKVFLKSDCSLSHREIKICVKGKEYELPFELYKGTEMTIIFLSSLTKSDIELHFSGEAQWKCMWKWR